MGGKLIREVPNRRPAHSAGATVHYMLTLEEKTPTTQLFRMTPVDGTLIGKAPNARRQRAIPGKVGCVRAWAVLVGCGAVIAH